VCVCSVCVCVVCVCVCVCSFIPVFISNSILTANINFSMHLKGQCKQWDPIGTVNECTLVDNITL